MRAIDIRRLEQVAKKYSEIETLLDKIEKYTYIHDEPFHKNTSLNTIIDGMIRDVQNERSYVERKIHAIKEMNDENALIISVNYNKITTK
jgi:hypothetical protein